MGNNFCCPARTAEHQSKHPSLLNHNKQPDAVLLHEDKVIAKPVNNMAKRSSKLSRMSQTSHMSSSNNTMYYSFEGNMEGSMRISTTKSETGAFTGNVLSQLNESSNSGDRNTDASPYGGSKANGDAHFGQVEVERSQSMELRQSKMRLTEQPFHAISEENEEHEEESFHQPPASQKGSVMKVSLIKGRNTNTKIGSFKSDNSILARVSIRSSDQSEARRTEWANAAETWMNLLHSIQNRNLEGFEKICEEKKAPHKLKMFLNAYENQNGNKVNRSISEWIVPFRAEQYIRFMSNFEVQKTLDKNMDLYEHLETFGETGERWYSVYYIAYKKVLIASPRDFVYLKHVRKIDENTWADVSKSIAHEDYPEFKDKVRGDIILSGSIVTEFTDPETGKIHSKVRLYSENNFKLNIPTFLAKSFAGGEMKKFIELSIQRMGQIY